MPGGPALSRLAAEGGGDASAVPMPRLRVGELDFSFSGIKTHAARLLEQGLPPADVAAGFERAVVEALVDRLRRGARAAGVATIGLGGGVAANLALRAAAAEMAAAEGLTLVVPRFEYCTDNAAMIGSLGCFMLGAGQRSGLDADARSVAEVGEVRWG
jgi:N6-L-threonylcarbamoyladenine synthase